MLLIILEIIALMICTMAALHVYFRYGRFGRLLDQIHGPPTVPFFGNVFQFLVSDHSKIMNILYKMHEKYYPIYRVWGMHFGVVLILHPDYAEAIMTTTSRTDKSVIYNFLKPWLGDGLVISNGKKWHHRRKILTPAFHFSVLQKYLEVLVEHGANLAECLKTDKTENKVELAPFLTYHTLSAICETAMGTSFKNIDPHKVKEYREAVHTFEERALYRLLRPWIINDFIYNNFTSHGRNQKELFNILHGFSRKIIRERKECLEQVDTKTKTKRLAMLDLLIQSSKEGLIDDEGIAEEVDTFIFEGHDTSAMALVFIVQLLAEHEDIQEKARAEVNAMWESCDGKIDMNALNNLPYLERCIKESLRLFPSVPFISRVLREDIKIKNYILPAGTITHIFIHEIHMDPNFWPEPKKFDPDRFLPENFSERHPFCYIPFSGGPRNCIGQRFAMMEMKIFTAFILKNYKMKACMSYHDIVRTPNLTFRARDPIFVKFYELGSDMETSYL